MRQSDRTRFYFGPYKAPPWKVGQEIQCAIRGKVTIIRASTGRIRWPVCHPQGRPSPVIYHDLERAIRQESTSAVAHWWGVSLATAGNWRRALGVERYNEGTLKLRAAGYADPARSRKMRAAKLGKKRTPLTDETKAKIGAGLKRYHGT